MEYLGETVQTRPQNFNEINNVRRATLGETRNISDSSSNSSRSNFYQTSKNVGSPQSETSLIKNLKSKVGKLLKDGKELADRVLQEEKKNVWKSKYYRLLNKNLQMNSNDKTTESEKDRLLQKVNSTLNKGTDSVKKNLLYYEALFSQLKENQQKFKSEKEKSFYSNVISGKIVKKYRQTKKKLLF